MIGSSRKYYINGNYLVKLDTNNYTLEKRPLRRGESFIPSFPDSIDIKLTNKCNIGCPFCHESSVPDGKTFNPDHLKKLLSELPSVGIELAFGGGDVLEIKDELKDIVNWSKHNGFYPRITINYKDIVRDSSTINMIINLFIPIGISINSLNKSVLDDINTLDDASITFIPAIVYHIIIGVLPVDDLKTMLFSPDFEGKRILILGFKQFGRAKDMNISDSILAEWKNLIREYILKFRTSGETPDRTLAFDNLALEQLEMKNYLLSEEWNTLFMGNDFSHSMYIDAVTEEFAPTSRSSERINWSKAGGILNYFRNNKKSYD